MAGYAYDGGRLTILGTIDGAQSWSINIGFTAADPNSADLLTWLPTLDTAISTWWNTTNGPKAINKTTCIATGTRAEFWTAGTTVPSAAATHSFSSALVGTSTAYSPTQTALVHSLITGRPGKSYRGRLYVPATAIALGSAARASSAVVDACCNSMATLLHAINISTLAGSAPAVVVRGHVATPQPVVTVRVDDEPDIQRRRADKLVPSYTKTASV